MKLLKFTSYLLVVLNLSSFLYVNIREAETAERIKMSFKMGNAHGLAEVFEKNLELVIDAENIDFKRVTSDQAELIVKGFFKKYPPKDFRYGFQGTASKVRYCTATYQTVAGNKFQVYILMRITHNDYRINTLHFKKV